MELKKAYIFSGHIRTFKEEWFDFDKDCDVYIHTYDRLGYWSAKDTVNMNTEHVTTDYILGLFKNKDIVKSIVIESENSKIDIVNKYSKIMEKNKIHYARPYNFLSMHMKRLSALETFFEEVDKNKKIYDIVYLFRPDYRFRLSNLNVKNDIVYIEGYNKYNRLSDFFIISNMSQMKLLKDIYIDSIENYVNNYKSLYDPHSYFYFLMTNYFKYTFINCGGNSTLLNTLQGYCKE